MTPVAIVNPFRHATHYALQLNGMDSNAQSLEIGARGHEGGARRTRGSCRLLGLLKNRVDRDAKHGNGGMLKPSSNLPVSFFEGQAERIKRRENISGALNLKAGTLCHGEKLAARVDSRVANPLANKFRKPRDQRDVRSNRKTANLTGVTLERVELIWNEKDQRPARLQNTKALLQGFAVAMRMLQDFDHRDDIKALRGKRQTLPGCLNAGNLCPERLQVRHQYVGAENGCATARQFGGVTSVATPQVQNTLAFQVERRIDSRNPLCD